MLTLFQFPQVLILASYNLNTGLRSDRAAKDEYYPLLARAHRNTANRPLKRERYSNAVREYGIALKYVQDYAVAHEERGHARIKSGDERRGLKDYETATRLDPGDFRTFHARGFYFAGNGMTEEAIPDFDRAITL